MVDTEKRFKNWTRIILLIAIITTCVFIPIFGLMGVKIKAETTCGRDSYGAIPNAVYDNRTDLDNTGDYVLQEFELNRTTNYIKYEFCFTAFCVPAAGCQIDVINQDGAILMSEFEAQGQVSHCSMIENITDHQYLGLNCPTCANAAAEAKVQEVVGGSLVNIVEENANQLSVIEDYEINYQLHAYKDCRGFLKYWLWLYVILMAIYFFVILILIGFRRFEKFIFEEIDLTKGN